MLNLEKRIAYLEQANPPAEVLTIIRLIVGTGQLIGEVCRLRGDDGEMWARLPGETERELINRATLEVKRSPWGVARLIEVMPC